MHIGGIGFFTVVTIPPRAIFVLLPIFITLVLVSTAKLNHSLGFLAFIPPAYLVTVQSFRILVEWTLAQFYIEQLVPIQLTWHGRNFDVVIGLLALPVGWLLYKKHPFATKAGIAFNILGLISLFNIVTIALPSIPSGFRIYDTNYLPTYFPGVLITWLASGAAYLHILSLRQLRNRGRITQ